MGTSISNRSPDTARWRAVRSAYLHGLPDERVALEITRAAEPWREALLSPAVAAFLSTIVDSFEDVPRQLAQAEPDAVVRNITEAAYEAAVASSGDVSGLAMAERALQRTLISCLRREGLISETSRVEAAAQWIERRGGAPRDLAARFVADVLQQFGRHVIARDVGGLVGTERFPNTEAARTFAARIAGTIAVPATDAFLEAAQRATVADAWHEAITSLFARPEWT